VCPLTASSSAINNAARAAPEPPNITRRPRVSPPGTGAVAGCAAPTTKRESGANVHATAVKGDAPLHLASNAATVRFLLERGLSSTFATAEGSRLCSKLSVQAMHRQ
jgi:hypothetical protein